MTKQDLEDLNAELIDLLTSVRDRIDDKLDELAAIAEDEEDGDLDEDEAD